MKVGECVFANARGLRQDGGGKPLVDRYRTEGRFPIASRHKRHGRAKAGVVGSYEDDRVREIHAGINSARDRAGINETRMGREDADGLRSPGAEIDERLNLFLKGLRRTFIELSRDCRMTKHGSPPGGMND